MSKFLDRLNEIFNWIRIAISPALIGIIIGYSVYIKFKNTNGLLIGILISSIGIFIGILWATRVWKTSGTANFMSRIEASPELDNKDLKNEK